MIETLWQIWENEDQTEGTTLPVTNHAYSQLIKDTDDRPMKLLHEYYVTGVIENEEHVRRAFAYSKKWLYDEGHWPYGCRPKEG